MVMRTKNAPELPIGRFLKVKSLGGNRVILFVRCEKSRCRSIAKNPYTVEAAESAGIHCYGDVSVTLPKIGNATITVTPSWIYYVDVCQFTFVFFSVGMIREYLAFYSLKILPSSRFYNPPWSGGAPPGINEVGQTRFERLPLRLRKEPNRQRVIKALERAIALFENDEC